MNNSNHRARFRKIEKFHQSLVQFIGITFKSYLDPRAEDFRLKASNGKNATLGGGSNTVRHHVLPCGPFV
jgi:hypothetical protein